MMSEGWLLFTLSRSPSFDWRRLAWLALSRLQRRADLSGTLPHVD